MESSSDSISIIAHKIRTPLTVITSTVDNLLEGAFGSITKKQEEWLKKLEVHTANLGDLLDEILEILRKEPERANLIHNSITGKPGAYLNHPVLVSSPMTVDPNAPPQETPVVLLVDDEPDILDIVEQGLSSKGYKTLTATNGEEGLEIALSCRPDLILMDVLLKNENGINVCRTIKSKMDVFTPVILVTGQDDLREKISGSRHDADDLLTKPFQMEELFARVSSMVRLKKLHEEVERLRRKG